MSFKILFGLLWALTTQPKITSKSLEDLVKASPEGAEINLEGGIWKGNITINKPINLKGPGTIQGNGTGTVLRLDAPNIVLSGVTIQGSGRDLRGPDCAVFLTKKAKGSKIDACTFRDFGFGIWINETTDVILSNNIIEGETTGNPSNRGNGIQLFNGKSLKILNNHIQGGRDGIYVSVTEDSLIQGNETRDLRFGVHYMYSDHNRVINNVSFNNVIGYALMQSKYITAIGNIARNNDRNGLLFRDAQYCDIRKNILENNGEGMFFFSSTDNKILLNRLVGNKVGVKVWAGSLRNQVEGNSFIDNRRQVFYVAASNQTWGSEKGGNYWSDYLGWDQNGDGIGDRPYRVNNFSNNLIYKYPVAILLLRSPSLELLAQLEHKLPVFRAPTVIDKHPLIKEPE